MKHQTSETLDLLLASHQWGAETGFFKASALLGWGILSSLVAVGAFCFSPDIFFWWRINNTKQQVIANATTTSNTIAGWQWMLPSMLLQMIPSIPSVVERVIEILHVRDDDLDNDLKNLEPAEAAAPAAEIIPPPAEPPQQELEKKKEEGA